MKLARTHHFDWRFKATYSNQFFQVYSSSVRTGPGVGLYSSHPLCAGRDWYSLYSSQLKCAQGQVWLCNPASSSVQTGPGMALYSSQLKCAYKAWCSFVL